MLLLGTLSCLGYGPLAGVTVIGMQFLDFFDFLTNSVMMPIAAIATCLLVSRVIGVAKIEQEVTDGGHPFRRKVIFQFMIQYLCPIFAAIILIMVLWRTRLVDLDVTSTHPLRLQPARSALLPDQTGSSSPLHEMYLYICGYRPLPSLPSGSGRLFHPVKRTWSSQSFPASHPVPPQPLHCGR